METKIKKKQTKNKTKQKEKGKRQQKNGDPTFGSLRNRRDPSQSHRKIESNATSIVQLKKKIMALKAELGSIQVHLISLKKKTR